MRSTANSSSCGAYAGGATASPVDSSLCCNACGCTDVRDFFAVPSLPVSVGIVHDSAAEALQAPQGSVALAFCTGCQLVFNRRFEPEKVAFRPGYEVQLIHSGVFREFLDSVARRLIDRYDVRRKSVVDVGCGAGHFLERLCRFGDNAGYGFDPSLPDSVEVVCGAGPMHLIRGTLAAAPSDLQCDLATSQSVLECIWRPVEFVRGLGTLCAPRSGVVYVEVFNAWRSFESEEAWSVCYEMCNHFSRESLTNIVARAGLEVVELGGCYQQDQYLYVEARPRSEAGATLAARRRPSAAAADGAAGGLPQTLQTFADRHRSRLEIWGRRTDMFRRQRRRVALWGAGGKGIVFLNLVPQAEAFQAVVDVNPDRQGRFVPGSGHPIIAPERLRDLQPDVIAIANPLYEGEIRQALGEMGMQAEIMTI